MRPPRTRHPHDPPRAPSRIFFLGLFGVGNFGNDTSLAIAADAVRARRPDAELSCVCPAHGAEEVRSRFGLATVDLQTAGRVGQWMPRSRVARRLIRPVVECGRLVAAWRELRHVDQLVVPGTGFFDDFGVSPTQTPLDTFRWMLAARVRRVPVALISIGAGPIHQRLSAFLLLRPVRWAAYVSVRDPGSRQFLADRHAPHGGLPVRPDLAFGCRVPPEQCREDTPTRVGIGLMGYYGWRMDQEAGAAQHERYIAGIVEFAVAMLDHGHSVDLATGDRGDGPTLDAVATEVRRRRPDLADRLTARGCTDMDDVVAWAGRCDVTVASRYHNVIGALLAGCPVATLSYAGKFDDLVSTVGLDDCLQHIESFSADRLIADVKRLLEERAARSELIAEVVTRNDADVADEFDVVFGKVVP